MVSMIEIVQVVSLFCILYRWLCFHCGHSTTVTKFFPTLLFPSAIPSALFTCSSSFSSSCARLFFFRLCLRFLSTAIRPFLGAVLSLRSVTSRQRGPGQSWRRCSSHRNHPDAIRCCVKLILSISDFSCQWFVRFDWCVVRSKLVQAARFARTSFDPSTSHEGIFPSSLLR